MTPSGSEVVGLSEADVPAASELLAQAFFDNPSFLALLDDPSPSKRLAKLRGLQRLFVRQTLRHGQVMGLSSGQELRAALLAFPPGAYPWPPRMLLGLSGSIFWLGLRGTRRGMQLSEVMDRRHLSQPHWYVFTLGVAPAHQGQGHGSALLKALHALADREGSECFLETDRPENVRLYERHGYRVASEDHFPQLSDLTMWTMRRNAREHAAESFSQR